MHDGVVDGGAQDRGIASVAEKGRFGSQVLGLFGRQMIELPGAHARPGRCGQNVQHFSYHQVRLAQLGDLCR